MINTFRVYFEKTTMRIIQQPPFGARHMIIDDVMPEGRSIAIDSVACPQYIGGRNFHELFLRGWQRVADNHTLLLENQLNVEGIRKALKIYCNNVGWIYVDNLDERVVI
jgi:hypothetical protein